MTFIKQHMRWLAGPLAAVFFITTSGLGAVAHAGIVATDDVAMEQSASADRAALLSLLARDDVRQELIALGVEPDEAADRIGALSNAEVAQIMNQVDDLPAGEGAVGAIVGAALIVFIILLITDIIGVTSVFSFVN